MDKTRLIKILNLTTSLNDHEALSAIRSANRILEKENKTWDDVFKEEKKFTVGFGPSTYSVKTEPSVNQMLDRCLSVANNPSVVDFLESLQRQWRTKQYLTPKQMQALKNFYRQCK